MSVPTHEIDPYKERGFFNRRDYLENLAFDLEVSIDSVEYLSELLGPEEDFDGLVTAIKGLLEPTDFQCLENLVRDYVGE
jgi:hypothetical protein